MQGTMPPRIQKNRTIPLFPREGQGEFLFAGQIPRICFACSGVMPLFISLS